MDPKQYKTTTGKQGNRVTMGIDCRMLEIDRGSYAWGYTWGSAIPIQSCEGYRFSQAESAAVRNAATHRDFAGQSV